MYSASADGFCILQLQEVSYLIKFTTMGAINQETQRKRNKQLSMQGQTNFANIV